MADDTKKPAAAAEDKITVKYTGDQGGTFVPGFIDGRGYFKKKGSQHTYSDPDEVRRARNLVAENPNFEEVER